MFENRIGIKSLIVSVFLVAGFIYGYISSDKVSEEKQIEKELIAFELLIESTDFSSSKAFAFFKEISEKNGAEYGYGVLRKIPEAKNLDMHLLGHVVGDILYKQKGVEGIKICTQEFRNACSHSIVVGYLLEKGESELPKIAEICRKAPGGSGAYTMCFHGLGHGILAYTGYEMSRASDICEKTGTIEYSYNEISQCIGGAVMEIISGGFHDPQLWKIQSSKYLPKEDPLFICKSELIKDRDKGLCYTYLTPHLLSLAGADLGNPNPATFSKAFSFCKTLKNESNKTACYGGFGKEFIVLANNRDIRILDKMDTETIKKIYNWCNMAIDKDGIRACVLSAASSLYWGGENDKSMVIKFCDNAPEENLRKDCFLSLIQFVNFYIKERGYRNDFCKEIPSEYISACTTKLL